MPTGRCNYPEHHGPSAGPPFALIGLIALGAVVVAFWHAVIVVLVVVLALAGITCGVVALLHNHRRHYDPELERAALQQRARAALPQRQPAAATPAVHNHVHLHGTAAAAAERPADPQPLPAVAALWGLPEAEMQAILDRAGISAELLAARIAGGVIRGAIEDKR